MSIDNRMFLGRGGLENADGSRAILKLVPHTPEEPVLEREENLDDALWLNPENAHSIATALLLQHKGELTPTLTRIALKAASIGLFEKEYAGEEVAIETLDAAMDVNLVSAEILSRLLELVDDEDVDQATLDQSITDFTTLNLGSRLSGEKFLSDITLLPIGPNKLYADAATNFVVLRQKKLGRAHLVVTDNQGFSQHYSPDIDRHRILLSPADVTGPEATMHELARTIVKEQTSLTSIEDRRVIAQATDRLTLQVDEHFDRQHPTL